MSHDSIGTSSPDSIDASRSPLRLKRRAGGNSRANVRHRPAIRNLLRAFGRAWQVWAMCLARRLTNMLRHAGMARAHAWCAHCGFRSHAQRVFDVRTRPAADRATAPSCAEAFRTIQAIKATRNAALQCINVQVQPHRIIIPYSRNSRVSTRQRLPGRASSRPLTALHKTNLKISPHFRHHFTFAPQNLQQTPRQKRLSSEPRITAPPARNLPRSAD